MPQPTACSRIDVLHFIGTEKYRGKIKCFLKKKLSPEFAQSQCIRMKTMKAVLEELVHTCLKLGMVQSHAETYTV